MFDPLEDRDNTGYGFKSDWYYVTTTAYNRSNLYEAISLHMPQNSRYDNNDIETMMNEILLVLEKRNASKDLSLMVLGNVISHIFNHQVPSEQRAQLAETFSAILHKTLTQE